MLLRQGLHPIILIKLKLGPLGEYVDTRELEAHEEIILQCELECAEFNDLFSS